MSDTVYTYICNDGYTRTRCRAHIPAHGPYAPHPTDHQVQSATDTACIQCDPQPADPEPEEE